MRRKFDLASEIAAAKPKAERSVRRILGERFAADVEDILQQAAANAVRVHGTKSGFKGNSAFSTWFTRVAINQALMWRRKPARRECGFVEAWPIQVEDADPVDYLIELADDKIQPADEALVEQERKSALLAAITRIESPLLREAALRMISREGLKSVNGTIKARKFRVRKLLRQDDQLREVIFGTRNSALSSRCA